jgi:hypothetical protein
VAGEETVLRDDARVQRELGDPVRHQVEVGRLLHVLGEELEEARVIHAVVVVVAGVHVERVLGDRARRDVQHVREPCHRRVQRLVHVHDPCPLRSSSRQPHHAHPAVTAAAACSPSGSKKSRRRPLR